MVEVVYNQSHLGAPETFCKVAVDRPCLQGGSKLRMPRLKVVRLPLKRIEQ